ncbi:MAG: hypothetical protein Q9204_007909 [Flavoplaca sp. TL-2023a]
MFSTAAHFTAQQLAVPLTYIKGGQEYRSYHADVLANEGVRINSWGEWYVRERGSLVPSPSDLHDHDRTQSIFVDALRTIQEAASQTLQRPLQIATVSVPEHFNDSSALAVIEAFKEVEPSYKQPWQVIKSGAATWLAYGLYTCEALGLNHDDCDVDYDLNTMIMVEYDETYLQLSTANVGSVTCNIETRVRFADLGENAKLDAVANASQEAGIQQKILQNEDSGSATTVQKKHYANIENTLSDFLMEQESAPRGFNWWDTVRAVVISGDASESGLQGLRGCVDNALGQHRDKMRDSIDPLYVEAMGAAQRGQHQVLNPRFLDDIVFSLIPEHDEL